jgi:hypothetical protein
LFDHRLYLYLHWMFVVVVEQQVNDDDEGLLMDDLVEELQMEVLVNDVEAKNV